jgi:hypothetical protein
MQKKINLYIELYPIMSSLFMTLKLIPIPRFNSIYVETIVSIVESLYDNLMKMNTCSQNNQKQFVQNLREFIKNLMGFADEFIINNYATVLISVVDGSSYEASCYLAMITAFNSAARQLLALMLKYQLDHHKIIKYLNKMNDNGVYATTVFTSIINNAKSGSTVQTGVDTVMTAYNLILKHLAGELRHLLSYYRYNLFDQVEADKSTVHNESTSIPIGRPLPLPAMIPAPMPFEKTQKVYVINLVHRSTREVREVVWDRVQTEVINIEVDSFPTNNRMNIYEGHDKNFLGHLVMKP